VKNLITVFLITLLALGTVYAQNTTVGTSGAQFLKIGVGSRYQGMGEASVAIANDVYSMYWNPAGLAEVQNGAIGFTNVNWLLDIDLNYVAFARYFEDIGVFGVSASVLSMDEMEITTFEKQSGTGEFYSASSYSIGATFARQLTNRFAFGGSVKYVGERIHNLRSSAIAFDFGTMLYVGYNNLRLGMSISNMGPDLEFKGSDLDVGYDQLQGSGNNPNVPATLKSTPYSLPMVFRVGVAYDFVLGPQAMLTMTGEAKHPNDNIQQGSLGAELAFQEKYFLRGGYKLNYEEERLAFGGGMLASLTKNTVLQIDYAWQDFGRLSSTQKFSVGFIF